ncbi:hypothetical protein CEXT_470251 [Caerostris extrusa]|uniref:Uncharacterized protein n=1 Tax=Caerostris extrusa TaxID=172846 RepID=A0AAV4QJR7_CAEEX|nr:hypothetical protein CEXT_470251 [Caerostris extrusa]
MTHKNVYQGLSRQDRLTIIIFVVNEANYLYNVIQEESYPTSPCGRRQLIIEAASGNLTDLLTVECVFTVRDPSPLKSSKRAASQKYSEECVLERGVEGQDTPLRGKVKGPQRSKYMK